MCYVCYKPFAHIKCLIPHDREQLMKSEVNDMYGV